MYAITLNLSSDEWQRIKQHADKQWPYEFLSVSEILRRYILVGIAKLKNIPPQDAERLAHELQCSMSSNDERLRH